MATMATMATMASKALSCPERPGRASLLTARPRGGLEGATSGPFSSEPVSYEVAGGSLAGTVDLTI